VAHDEPSRRSAAIAGRPVRPSEHRASSLRATRRSCSDTELSTGMASSRGASERRP
jgi:hypothetical protein